MTARFGTLVLLLVAMAVLSLNLGSFPIAPRHVFQTLFGYATPQQELVLFNIRLPRLAMASLVGMGLAMSGCVLQGVSRNSLADPGILGLTSGAGLVIMLHLYLHQEGLFVPAALRPVAAFVGAALAAAAIYLLSRKHDTVEPGRMLLCGIAINAGLAAATLLISMRLDRRLYDAAVVWLSGSLSGKSWPDIAIMMPWFLVLAPLLLCQAKALDILGLGDEGATSLGVAVERKRLVLLLLAVALAAVSVALAGGIGFIALLGPHIARRLVGPRHHVLLPAAALVGALLMVIADAMARNFLAPIELPVGVVVAIIGAPFFLYLMIKAQDKVYRS